MTTKVDYLHLLARLGEPAPTTVPNLLEHLHPHRTQEPFPDLGTDAAWLLQFPHRTQVQLTLIALDLATVRWPPDTTCRGLTLVERSIRAAQRLLQDPHSTDAQRRCIRLAKACDDWVPEPDDLYAGRASAVTAAACLMFNLSDTSPLPDAGVKVQTALFHLLVMPLTQPITELPPSGLFQADPKIRARWWPRTTALLAAAVPTAEIDLDPDAGLPTPALR